MIRSTPWYEPPRLSIVTIVGQPKFGSDKENFPITDKYSTIEAIVSMHYGHANVKKDTVKGLILENVGEHLPGMEIGVGFEEVVCT